MSSIIFYSTRKTQKLKRIGVLQEGTLSDFSTFPSQNIKKNERESLKIFEQNLTMPKKLKGGPFCWRQSIARSEIQIRT